MNSLVDVRPDGPRSPEGLLLGAVRPRIRTVPEYATTAGHDAIELAAEAGLHLDEWQQADVLDILGETEDGLWAAFEAALIVARQNGKGGELEAIELAGLFIFRERLIIHTAHEFKTASEAYLRVKQLIVDTPFLHKKVRQYHNAHGEEGITLKTGQRLRFLARSKGSGRGFSADRLVYDEAYELPSHVVAASLPTLSARPNPQVIYTSSAPLEHSEHLKKVRDRGLKKPGLDYDSLCYLEYSAHPKGYDLNEDGKLTGLDLDDRRGWSDANPALSTGRIRESFIIKERATMADVDFARERLGIVEEIAINAVIDEERWAKLRDPGSVIRDPVVFGFDTNPEGTWSSIAVAGMRLDKKIHTELVDRQRGVNWLVDRMVGLVEDWEPIRIVVDAMSPATAMISRMAERGLEIEVTNTTAFGRYCGNYFDLYDSGQLRHIGQPELTAAAQIATKRIIGEGGLWAWARKDSTDIAPLVASTVAVGGYFDAIAEPEEEETDNKVVVFRRR